MRLVMGGESLLGQKTGIGQYTENLAREILKTGAINDFKFLTYGKLQDTASLLTADPGDQKTSMAAQSNSKLLANLRGVASRNPAAVWCYNKAMPLVERHMLRNYTESDVFHSPNYMLANFPGKRVVTILDLSTIKHPEFHHKGMVKFVNHHIRQSIQKADHIITISETVKSELVEHLGVEEERITTTYLAANCTFKPLTAEEFAKAAFAPDLEYKKYFLCACTLEPRKNISRLLDAYCSYRNREGDSALPLVLVGHRGWHSAELYSRILELGIANGVRYLGYVDSSSLPIIFAGARALIFPSIYEGFGLPILEAMQAGTAVLTSPNSAMSEVAQDAALFAEPASTEDIESKILLLASDDTLIARLTSAGRQKSSEFSWHQCAKQTLSVYGKLVA